MYKKWKNCVAVRMEWVKTRQGKKTGGKQIRGHWTAMSASGEELQTHSGVSSSFAKENCVSWREKMLNCDSFNGQLWKDVSTISFPQQISGIFQTFSSLKTARRNSFPLFGGMCKAWEALSLTPLLPSPLPPKRDDSLLIVFRQAKNVSANLRLARSLSISLSLSPDVCKKSARVISLLKAFFC